LAFIFHKSGHRAHIPGKLQPPVHDFDFLAGNPEYLGKFHDDLKNQRFSLIISEPLNTRLKGRAKSFGEENDAWVKNVSEPVLCYYEPFRTFRELRVQLLKPRSNPGACPDL